MSEGVESSLLGQQLLVGHRVDVRREAERGAERQGEKMWRQCDVCFLKNTLMPGFDD